LGLGVGSASPIASSPFEPKKVRVRVRVRVRVGVRVRVS